MQIINWSPFGKSVAPVEMTKDWVREHPIIIGQATYAGKKFHLVRFVDEVELYSLVVELARRTGYELMGMTIYSYPEEHDGSVQDAFLPGQAFVFLHLRR